jgi:Ca2+/Na+ antiporter
VDRVEPQAIGIIGGVVGTAVGIAGGVIGVRASVRNTETAAERRFMVRSSAMLVLAMVLLIGVPLALSLAGVLPRWAYWAAFALFFVFLGPAIAYVNRRQAELRRRDPAP